MNDIERFKIFEDDCKFWIENLMMEDYRFDIVLVDDVEEIAAMSYVFPAHHGFLQLASDVDDVDEIQDAALHEVLEALLMPMKLQCVNEGDVFCYTVQRETHAVIHRLSKILRGER